MHFSQFSYENFWKIEKISQEFAFFVETRKKLMHGLLIFIEKYAKIIHFRNSL